MERSDPSAFRIGGILISVSIVLVLLIPVLGAWIEFLVPRLTKMGGVAALVTWSVSWFALAAVVTVVLAGVGYVWRRKA